MIARLSLALFIAALSLNAAELNLAAAGPGVLNVSLRSGGAQLTGLQFDLDSTGAHVEIGPAASSSGKSLQTAGARTLIIGFNRNAIPDGVVAIIRLPSQAGASVHIVSATATDQNGKSIPLTLGSASQ